MQPERAIEDAAAITVGSQRRDRVIPILVIDDFYWTSARNEKKTKLRAGLFSKEKSFLSTDGQETA